MPKLFTSDELQIMDGMTANNPVVLSSLGGKPEMPEVVLAEKSREGSVEEHQGDGSDETLGEEHERAVLAMAAGDVSSTGAEN